MSAEVLEFPQQQGATQVNQPAKGEGIATLKNLRKKMSEIELAKVRKIYVHHSDWKNEEDHSKGLKATCFNRKFNKKTEEIEISLGLTKRKSTRYSDSMSGISLPKEVNSLHRGDLDAYAFSGGKNEYNKGVVRANFTAARVVVEPLKGDIIYISYALDSEYLNDWLRSIIDPSVLNNHEEIRIEQDFTFIVSTTTYEKMNAKGFDEDQARENAVKNDPTLHIAHSWYSSDYQGVRNIYRKYDDDGADEDFFQTREEYIAKRDA